MSEPRRAASGLLLLLTCCWQGWTAHGAQPGVRLLGALPTTGTVTLAQLQQAAEHVTWVEHGTTHTVVGAPLNSVLRQFGLGPGPEGKQVAKREKRSGWKHVLIARARDGYMTAFSFAELAPEIGPTTAYIAWDVDGKALDDKSGPLRLVVTSDKEPARCVFQLESIRVLDLRRQTAD